MIPDPGPKPRILLVGDDPGVNAVVVPLLESEGYAVERAVVMQIPDASQPDASLREVDNRSPSTLARRAVGERWSLERLEREYILGVLDEVNHHQMKAAAILGIDRRTLYRKLRSYRAA